MALGSNPSSVFYYGFYFVTFFTPSEVSIDILITEFKPEEIILLEDIVN